MAFHCQPRFLAIIDQGQWVDINNFQGTITASSGSGQAATGLRRALTRTGATAGSTASVRTDTTMGWSTGQGHNVLDWSKRIVLHAVFTPSDSTSNGISRLTLGKGSATGVGDLADKGIGLQIDQLALKGIVHDGTSGATVDLSATLTEGTTYAVTIVSDGSGNLEWFLDGASKGSSSAGPTGLATAGFVALQSEVDNGADSAFHELIVHDVKAYVEQ